MGKQNNTGLGLMIATIQRVQNQKSLFASALKKLVNSNEEEITVFLEGKFNVKCKEKGEFTSKLFQKTNIIKISKNSKSFMIGENSVMDFLEPIIKREKDLKNPNPFIDNDLWRYFINKTAPSISEDFVSVVYRFLSNLTHKQILEEAENSKIKKVYSYLEGLSIIKQAILDGEVDNKNTGIIVYFKVKGVKTLYRFRAFRYGDGRLRVSVIDVGFDDGWRTTCGACFSN